jgi:hypothetical protein
MVHPVQEKVATISRRARTLRLWHGLGLTAALVVATAFLLGVTDYLVRFQDPGIRALSSATLGAVLLLSALRWLVPAWRYRPSDRQVAQRIEQRFPQLQDRLSSTIDFLGQSEDDRLAGSPALRRAVIAGTGSEIERLDFPASLDVRRPRRSAIWAAVVGIVVGGVCAWDVNAAWIATRRLLRPWSADPWPQRYVLEFTKQPTRLAVGADFEAELVARSGRLPEAVKFYCWFDGSDQRNAQVTTMKVFGDKLVQRLENVRRGFQYRAVADDEESTPWIRLDVVEPPQVAALSLRLHPPAYTGWPVEQSGENILALEGTRVEIAGRLTKPAVAVELRTDQKDSPATVSVRVTGDGTEFRLPADAPTGWTLQESVAYWFVVTDPEGLQGGGQRRWNARVVRDAPPTVTLEKPGTNTFVTREAVVPLAALVKDDLAIHFVELRFRRSDAPGEQEASLELQRGAKQVPRAAAGSFSSRSAAGETRTVRYAWDLASLKDLGPGASIEFSIAASDYRPQVGVSTVRRLTVISSEELEDRIAARQGYILGQLADVLTAQRTARTLTKSLEIQLETAGQLGPSDVNQLQAAELSQRQVGKLLADPQDGVQTQITGLLDELASNRIDSPEIVRRMRQLLEVVEQLNRDQLPEIQRALISAQKSAGELLTRPGAAGAKHAPKPDEALTRPLRTAGAKQDEVIARLESVLGTMTQWDSYRRFAREFSRLRQQQQQVRQETERVRLDTLGKELSALTPLERASLKRLAERQLELARQVDKTQARMGEMQVELRESDPLAAETLADALEVARRTAISGQMRESGRDIEANRVGQAVDNQQEVLDHLQELLDALANRREHELERRLRKLDEAAAELQQLQRKQQELRARVAQAAAQANPADRQRELKRLLREQQELAEESRRLARRLQRLQSSAAAKLVEQAATSQQAAAQACEKANPAAALEKAQEAERLLEQAEQQLQAERQQAKQDLFQEQLARLEKEVGGLVGRQQALQLATTELQGLRQSQAGQFQREQLASLRDLAAQQRALSGDTGAVAEKVQAAAAFALAFRGAAQEMERAARQLDVAETGEPAQRPQQLALVRLQQVLEALKRDSQDSQNPPGKKTPPGPPPDKQPPGDAIQRLAELKLLKLLQEEINRRTSELQALRVRQRSLSPEQVRELADLTEQEGRLADLVTNLTPPASDKPADVPDEL